MPTITHSDYLLQVSGAGLVAVPGVWVRLLNNSTATNYYSTAVTTSTGAFTHSAVPGDYSAFYGTAATVPGTPTLVNAHYAVPVTAGDDAVLGSATLVVSSPYISSASPGTVVAATQAWVAAPTGVASTDTANIQAAINTVPAGTGGDVFFWPGKYVINAPLTVYTSCTRLLGSGSSGQLGQAATTTVGTIIFLANSSNVDMLKVGNAALGGVAIQNVQILNLTLDGNKANNTSGNGIVGSSWAGGGIEECTIHNMAGDGIVLNVDTGPSPVAGCCLQIRHNTVEFCSGNGINENGNVYDWIVGNHIEINKGNGIRFSGGNDHHVLYNNVLQSGNGYGSQSTASAAMLIQGTNHRVIGNFLDGNYFDGIDVYSTDSIFMGNTANATGSAFSGHCSSFVITGQRNLFVGNVSRDGGTISENYGFEERTGSANNRFIGNDSQNNYLGANGPYFKLANTTSKFWYNVNDVVANHPVTAGASPYTYTNNDGVPEVVMVTTVGGLTAITYKGQAGGAITAGIPFVLNPGETMIFTWATTAPVFQALPLTS